MTQAEAAAAFERLLAGREALFEHELPRRQGRLRVRAYAAAIAVPEALVLSVRAVVFKGSRVVVLSESDGSRHVMPGGRREAGETLEATVRRELLEECGWHVGELTPFAILHFQHPEPAPDEWREFANLIYLTEGLRYEQRALDRTQGDVRSRMMGTRAALGAVNERHQGLLAAAVAARTVLLEGNET